jgi:hypothetical protein
MAMIEHMKSLMMKNIMILTMTIIKKMEMKEAITMIASTVEKVVLMALWLVIIVVQSPLAMEMVDLVMFAMIMCITMQNQTGKVPTKK